ncbi:MAG: hypothetical protein JW861_05245 [Bacteroidales bacterium]|nr:hypothetical protein [Bacteroidales bacterium]
MINIAIIDQNRTYRESLKTMLEQIEGFRVVLISSDDGCLSTKDGVRAQIVLFDYNIPPTRWSEVTKIALATGMPYKILLLTMFREEFVACNYTDKMLKSSGKSEFEFQIKRMMETQESEFPDVYLINLIDHE